jgi:hypothetical protein
LSDDDIDIALDDPPDPVGSEINVPMVIKVVCDHPGCGQELAYIGYKWVHTQELPPDRAHQPQPVQAR